MTYLLILATLATDGAPLFEVQQFDLTLAQCEALLTDDALSCEPDFTEASIVIHQGRSIMLPRCRSLSEDNCTWDNLGYYLVDGRPFTLE